MLRHPGLLLIIVSVVVIASGIARAAPAPGRPATAPAANLLLFEGQFRFTIPDGWTRLDKRGDTKSAQYRSPDGRGVLSIAIVQQDLPVTPADRRRKGDAIIALLLRNAQAEQVTIFDGPKVEPDGFFYLRIHDRYRDRSQHVVDRLHVYRAQGINLVMVAAFAQTDSPAEAKAVHVVGEQVLRGMRTGPRQTGRAAAGAGAAEKRPGPAGPASGTGRGTQSPGGPGARPAQVAARFPRARLTLSGPAGWKAEVNDASSGIIATYRDPASKANFITVNVRPLPADVARDPRLRDATIDRIAASERTAFRLEGVEMVGKTEVLSDRRFLRKQRTTYPREGLGLQVESRQVAVGDSVITVASVASTDDASRISQIADTLALSIKPLGRK